MRLNNAAQISDLRWVPETSSTNLLLADLWRRGEAAHGTVVATDNQTAGKGRQGRSWQSPEGKSLAVSILLRGGEAVKTNPGWVPLIAGSAVKRAVDPLFSNGASAKIKWPNDVFVVSAEPGDRGRKVAGILSEMMPDGSIIVGVGLNIFLEERELPTERSGSLLASGADLGGAKSAGGRDGEMILDSILTSFIGEMMRLYSEVERGSHEILDMVLGDSHTVGEKVRVILPDGSEKVGLARGLGDDGALIVSLATGADLVVHAGDVWHLRDAR